MKSLWIATSLLALSILPSQAAVTVSINNFDASTPVVLNSTGALIDDTYSFALGSFSAGFDANDISTWQSNWNPLAVAINGGGWDTITREILFQGEINASNVANFPTGTQMYLWVYNTQTIQAGTEWALITDVDPTNNAFSPSWQAPDVSGPSPGDFAVAEADTVLYGGVNDITSPNGTRTGTPSDFQIQTHSVTFAPVPEPGSCLLVGLAGLALRLRRRRNA
jgi:hypothetical protein